MPLPPRTRLGPYEIISAIGAGGMGEVYRARDTRLDRTVAIKVVSEGLAKNPQARERFEREARVVSSLNHPHICTLHDIGHQDGIDYLVMEYLEGETLASRLAKGALPLDQALRFAIEIADALDVAHRHGIIHRDLKPGNVMLTKAGVKLLDFGLAKVRAVGAAAGATALPTQTTPLTGDGTVLGTLQYMAPEQLEGAEADARSDIFSLGALIYEMVAGRKAFEGKSQASVIAAILERDPPSVAGVAPAALDRLLSRCLNKHPDDRWQTARDLKAELEWIAESGPLSALANAPKQTQWRERTAWLTAAALLVTLALLLLLTPWRGRPLSTGDVVRFAVQPPEGTVFTGTPHTTVPMPQFALSPDGRALVFAAAAAGARPMFWLRSIEEVTARPLPGTEDAGAPFWSPDSRWVGFFAEGKLKKTPAASGAVQVVAEGVSDPRGGTWGRDDTILFGNGNHFINRVAAAGGTITPATKLDSSGGEASHRWPRFLPDGRHFLFTVRGSEQRGVFAGSLDGKTKKFLVRFDSSAFYLPGYLLWLDGDTLLGQAFDTDRLELSGQPFTVAERVGRSSASEGAVSASAGGTLAYAGAILRRGRLTWFDRSGNALDSLPAEGDYPDFRLSPDDKRLAASLVDPKTNNPDIWLTDLARGSSSRFTFGPVLNASPVWSPDGARLVFRTLRKGLIEFYQKSSFGGGNEEPVLSVEAQRAAGMQVVNLVPTDWSPDGRHIISSVPEIAAGFDLWLFPLAGNAKPVRLLGSASDEMHGNFSPDGKFVAYSSNESGRFQVYIQTFPLSDRKWPVSTNGGYEPRWRGDGREIYYLSEDRKLMAVSIGVGPSFSVPKPLFQTRVPAGVSALRTHYVPTHDGQRFLINTQSGDPAPNPITVVLNWTAGLKR